MDKKQYGERLKIAHIRKNLSQIDVAVALEEFGIELNQSTIGKIERGERRLDVHELAAFVEILEVSPDWVLKGGDLKIR